MYEKMKKKEATDMEMEGEAHVAGCYKCSSLTGSCLMC